MWFQVFGREREREREQERERERERVRGWEIPNVDRVRALRRVGSERARERELYPCDWGWVMWLHAQIYKVCLRKSGCECYIGNVFPLY